jgi:hypothetical protein
MTENEKDLEDLKLPPPETKVITFFGKNGREVQNENAYAKSVISYYGYNDSSCHYFIMTGRGELIDPYVVDYGISRNKISTMYKYKKVSEKAFESYLRYLKTKNRIHFTTARRLVME